MATFESVIANVRNMPERAAAALQSLRQENKDHLSSNLVLESLRGPLHYKAKWEHGATEFDHFDTLVPCAAGAIIGSVIGTDLDLYATTSSQNEAGVIVYHDDCPMWSIPTPGPVGGSFRWALVILEWGLGELPASNRSTAQLRIRPATDR